MLFLLLLMFFGFSFFEPQDWDSQNGSQIVTQLCGFVTILSGTFLLHKTKDMGNTTPRETPVFQSPAHPIVQMSPQ